MGARGSFVATASMHELVPSFPVKAVDTTVAPGEGKLLRDAARFANAAAAISVTRLGAQPSAPDRKVIEALLSA